MNRAHLRSIALVLAGAVIVAAFLYYLYANWGQYVQLLRLSATGVVFILLISLAFPVVGGLQNVYLFESLHAHVSFRDGCLLAASSTFANLLPIPGGILTRGFYLKRVRGLSYTKYFSATLALYAWTLALSGAIGMAILLWWLVNHRQLSPLLWIGFAAMAGCPIVFWLPLERTRILGGAHGWAVQALEGWTVIRREPDVLVKLLGLQAGLILLLSIRYLLAFQMLSQAIGIGQALMFSSASVLTQVVSIAPGGLGVREAIVGGVASALGFQMSAGVGAAGLDRLISTPLVVALGWFSTVLLGRQVGEASADSEHDDG